MKDNRKKLLKETIVCGLILILYYIFVKLTGLSIPCFFHEITGFKCPGCGLTAMCVALAHLRFAEAFHANPLMFLLAPLLIAALAIKIAFDPVWLGSRSKAYNITVWILLGIVIIFGITRNIFGF